MALVGTVGLTIAASFAALGFWPVLPYAGLEFGALGAALWVSLRRNHYREVVEFEGDRVRVSFGLIGQAHYAKVEWARIWTRVQLAYGPHRNSPTRLGLKSSGQWLVLGRCLTDEERERLHGRLKQLLPPVWQPLPAAQPAADEASDAAEISTGG